MSKGIVLLVFEDFIYLYENHCKEPIWFTDYGGKKIKQPMEHKKGSKVKNSRWYADDH